MTAAYAQWIFARAEAARAKAERKFPQPNYVALKVAEEAGELVKAAVHYAEGRESWENVEAEAVQTIAMVVRLLVEGDRKNGVVPPALPAPHVAKQEPATEHEAALRQAAAVADQFVDDLDFDEPSRAMARVIRDTILKRMPYPTAPHVAKQEPPAAERDARSLKVMISTLHGEAPPWPRHVETVDLAAIVSGEVRGTGSIFEIGKQAYMLTIVAVPEAAVDRQSVAQSVAKAESVAADRPERVEKTE